MQIYKKFFHKGQVREAQKKYAGCSKIPKMYIYYTSAEDGWIINSYAGRALNKCLFDIKSETIKGEPIYRIGLKKLHKSLSKNVTNLKEIIKDIAHAIHLLSQNDIVHSDVRLDNIMVKVLDYGDGEAVTETKLIDFSSAYQIGQIGIASNVVPEYLPQEILTHLKNTNTAAGFTVDHGDSLIKTLKKCPSSIDVWGLGCIILEILTAVPLWVTNKCMIALGTGKMSQGGLFATKDRSFDKIIEKQKKFIKNMRECLEKNSVMEIDDGIRQVIEGIFKADPSQRISPMEIVHLLN